jgi:hypothetical protein
LKGELFDLSNSRIFGLINSAIFKNTDGIIVDFSNALLYNTVNIISEIDVSQPMRAASLFGCGIFFYGKKLCGEPQADETSEKGEKTCTGF